MNYAQLTHATPQHPSPFPNTLADVMEFYPEPGLALQLWAVFVRSVDPVTKILHIPTVQSSVISTILNPKSAGRSMIALTYAIYFAAVTALDHNDEHVELPEEGAVLLRSYRSCLDKLLVVTDLMNQPEMTALQALVIYVVSFTNYFNLNISDHFSSDLFTCDRERSKCMDPRRTCYSTREINRIASQWSIPQVEPLRN